MGVLRLRKVCPFECVFQGSVHLELTETLLLEPDSKGQSLQQLDQIRPAESEK